MNIFKRAYTSFRNVLALNKRSGYAAASGSPRWPAWANMPAPASQTLAAAHLTGTRAAFAIANIPLAANITSVWVDSVIPDQPSVQIVPRNRTVEQAFQVWLAKNLAALRLMEGCFFRSGEALAIMRVDRRGDLYLVALNPEQLDRSVSRDLDGGGRILNGVELDANDEVVAYWILPDAPDLAYATIAPARRILAEDVIHYYEKKFPGQARGISALAPVLPRLNDYERLQDALLARAKTAALFGGFISDASGSGMSDATARAPEADLTMEPGALRVLPIGTDIKFPAMPDAGEAISLLKAMARDICSGVGVPYTLATGDLSDTNYSSGKLGLESFRRRITAHRAALLIPLVLEPLYRRWSLLRILNGKRAARAESLSFLFPTWASLEPKREAEADVILLNAGLRSRAEIVAGRGRDLADLDAEIAADTFVPKVAPKADQTSEREDA